VKPRALEASVKPKRLPAIKALVEAGACMTSKNKVCRVSLPPTCSPVPSIALLCGLTSWARIMPARLQDGKTAEDLARETGKTDLVRYLQHAAAATASVAAAASASGR
jgi:hypothetical protein